MITKKTIFPILLFILGFSFCFAQTGYNYFTFAPDDSKSTIVSAFDAVYQSFKPANDYISGFSIWIDNIGSSGSATFNILDENNNSVAVKTATIPYLAKKWGGHLFFVQFNEQIAVNSAQNYKIKIQSALPKLEIYYVNKEEYLEHNASYMSRIILGPAYLSSIEQNFIFKTALYEQNETSQPSVGNLNFEALQNNAMRVEFNANEPVDYKIEYQKTFQSDGGADARITNFSGNYATCINGMEKCYIEFTVVPDSTYNFQLYVKDYWGNQLVLTGAFESSQDGVFESSTPTSTPQGDEEMVISDVRIVDLTSKSVRVAWRTNFPAASRILISRDASHQDVAARLGDSTFELEHLLGSGDILLPITDYFAVIIADSFSSEIEGYEFTFQTLASTPQDDNLIQDDDSSQDDLNTQQDNQEEDNNPQDSSSDLPDLTVEESQSNNSGDVSINISWSAPNGGEPNNGYRIDIFDENFQLVKQLNVASGIHSIEISGLKAGNYRAIVYADNNAFFEKAGKATNFTVPDNRSVFEKISGRGAMIFVLIFGLILIGGGLAFKFIKAKKTAVNHKI